MAEKIGKHGWAGLEIGSAAGVGREGVNIKSRDILRFLKERGPMYVPTYLIFIGMWMCPLAVQQGWHMYFLDVSSQEIRNMFITILPGKTLQALIPLLWQPLLAATVLLAVVELGPNVSFEFKMPMEKD